MTMSTLSTMYYGTAWNGHDVTHPRAACAGGGAEMKTHRAVTLTGSIVVCLLAASACAGNRGGAVGGSGPAVASSPSPTAGASERTVQQYDSDAYRFSTIPQMVATADAVVEVDVLSVERGAVPTDAPPDAVTTPQLSTVRVLRVFNGTAPETLTISERGWDAKGRRIVSKGWAGLRKGNRAILFLQVFPGQPYHHFVMQSGIALITSEDALITGMDADDPAANKIKLMKPNQLRDEIAAARRVVEKEKIKALTIGEGFPDSPPLPGGPSMPPPTVDGVSPKVCSTGAPDASGNPTGICK